MARLIEIKRCVDCPYIANLKWHCEWMNRKLSSFDVNIPDWCPLPVAPVKEERKNNPNDHMG